MLPPKQLACPFPRDDHHDYDYEGAVGLRVELSRAELNSPMSQRDSTQLNSQSSQRSVIARNNARKPVCCAACILKLQILCDLLASERT